MILWEIYVLDVLLYKYIKKNASSVCLFLERRKYEKCYFVIGKVSIFKQSIFCRQIYTGAVKLSNNKKSRILSENLLIY